MGNCCGTPTTAGRPTLEKKDAVPAPIAKPPTSDLNTFINNRNEFFSNPI